MKTKADTLLEKLAFNMFSDTPTDEFLTAKGYGNEFMNRLVTSLTYGLGGAAIGGGVGAAIGKLTGKRAALPTAVTSGVIGSLIGDVKGTYDTEKAYKVTPSAGTDIALRMAGRIGGGAVGTSLIGPPGGLVGGTTADYFIRRGLRPSPNETIDL